MRGKRSRTILKQEKKNTSHKLGRKNDYDGDDDDVFSTLIYTWTAVRGKKTQTFRVNFLFLFVSVRIFEYFPIDVCLSYDIVHASRQFLKKQKKRQLEFRRTRT